MGFFLTLWFVSSAWAASFDCAKAATPVEKLICDAPELSAVDEDLSAVYKRIIGGVPQDDRQSIRSHQGEWLRFRDARCRVPVNPDGLAREASIDCLHEKYRQRIWQLEAMRPCIDQGIAGDIAATEEWECPEGEVPLTKKVCEEAYTTFGMAMCTDVDLARAHWNFVSAYVKRLDAVQQRAGEHVELFERYSLALKEEQDAWERLMSVDCELDGMQFEGGTLQGLTVAACRVTAVKARTSHLKPAPAPADY